MIYGSLIALGPVVPADFPSLFRWADDVEAARVNEPYRPPVWKSQEELWFGLGRDATRIQFAIRKRNVETIIGFIQITNIDPIYRSASIGIKIGDAVNRGQGFGSEAMRLAIDYCWSHLNLSRLSITVFDGNSRALPLYHRLGFSEEGRLRKAVFIQGAWQDVILMALLHPSRG